MGRADELRAELAAAELAERLVAMKADPEVPTGGDDRPPSEEYQQLKLDLREARRVHRTLREAAPPEETAGDAVARPDTIAAKGAVKRPGGAGK